MGFDLHWPLQKLAVVKWIGQERSADGQNKGVVTLTLSTFIVSCRLIHTPRKIGVKRREGLKTII